MDYTNDKTPIHLTVIVRSGRDMAAIGFKDVRKWRESLIKYISDDNPLWQSCGLRLEHLTVAEAAKMMDVNRVNYNQFSGTYTFVPQTRAERKETMSNPGIGKSAVTKPTQPLSGLPYPDRDILAFIAVDENEEVIASGKDQADLIKNIQAAFTDRGMVEMNEEVVIYQRVGKAKAEVKVSIKAPKESK